MHGVTFNVFLQSGVQNLGASGQAERTVKV